MPSKLIFILNLAGSISLLLWGSYMVREAVEKAYAARIGMFISRASGSRIRSFLCGVVSALILQSTTATVLLTTSFITSGLLTLGIAIVVIIGADLGSALAVRILFLDLTIVAPLLLLAGLSFHRFARTWRRQQLGRILIGVGLMLLSIQLIKQIFAPIAVNPISENILTLLNSAAWAGFILAALATWLAHSSVAIILVIASMAQAGIIQPQLFLALLLGANVGSGLIPLFLVNRSNLEAYSAVLANFLMRFSLAFVLFLLSSFLFEFVTKFGASGGLQVINMHITFNCLLVALFVPLNQIVGRFSKNLLSARIPEDLTPDIHEPGSSLKIELVKKPELALSCAKREAFRLADNTEALFTKALHMFETHDRLAIEQLIKSDNEINLRNKSIQRYLAEARRHIHEKIGVDSEEENRLNEILRFSATMENIGDIVSHNLARLALKRQDRGVEFSSEGHEELNLLHRETLSLVQLEITSFGSQGGVKQKKKNKLIESIRQLGQESISNHRQRLSDRRADSMDTSSIYHDAVRDLLQVVDYITNIERG